MKLTAWQSSVDSRELLRFAATRIPRQHLALVLVELASGAWRHWNKLNSDDWRPALCTAALRGWCFGEVTLAELQIAKEHAYTARSEAWNKYAAAAYAAAYDAAAYDAAAYAAAYAAAAYAAAAYAAADRYRWSQRWSEEFAKELARSAGRVRALIPYPAEVSSVWEVVGLNQQRAGNALLRLDGWVLVDAVALSDFGKDHKQAVAFDMAGDGCSLAEIDAAMALAAKLEALKAVA